MTQVALHPSADKSQLAESLRVLRRVPRHSPNQLVAFVRRHDSAERPVLWLLSLVLFALVWQGVADLAVRKPFLLPAPGDVAAAAWQMFIVQRTIYGDIGTSATEAGIGFAISLLAIPLGLVVGSSRRLTTFVEPINAAVYALPHIALVPTAIIWFGLGMGSKVFIVVISAFFLIFINTIAGVTTVDRELRNVARAFEVSPVRAFLTLTVPGTVPFIVAGIRLGVGRALVGVVGAELFAANQGLGFLLGIYGEQFRTASLFVVIGTFAFAGAALTLLVDVVARRFERWRVR